VTEKHVIKGMEDWFLSATPVPKFCFCGKYQVIGDRDDLNKIGKVRTVTQH
jgi:hypothetical protein